MKNVALEKLSEQASNQEITDRDIKVPSFRQEDRTVDAHYNQVIHKPDQGKETTEIQRVIIESSTLELREYFTKFGSIAFNRREPTYYRKVVK